MHIAALLQSCPFLRNFSNKANDGVTKWFDQQPIRWRRVTRVHISTTNQCEILKRRDGFKSTLLGFSWLGPTGKRLLVWRLHIRTELRWISKDSTMIRWRGCLSKQPTTCILIDSRTVWTYQKKPSSGRQNRRRWNRWQCDRIRGQSPSLEGWKRSPGHGEILYPRCLHRPRIVPFVIL
jgi:hypothetical protein